MKKFIKKIFAVKTPVVIIPIILIPSIIGIVFYYNNKLENYMGEIKDYVDKTISYADNIKNETKNIVSDNDNVLVDKELNDEKEENNEEQSTQKKVSKTDSQKVETKVETVYVDRVQKEIVEVIKHEDNKDKEKNENTTNHEHAFTVKNQEDSTCIKNGKIEYECKDCKYKYSDVLEIAKDNHTNTLNYANIIHCKDCGNSTQEGFLMYYRPTNRAYTEQMEAHLSTFSKVYLNNRYYIELTLEEGTRSINGTYTIEFSDGTIDEGSIMHNMASDELAPCINFTARRVGKAKITININKINSKVVERVIEKEIDIIDPAVEVKNNLEHKHNFEMTTDDVDSTAYLCMECQYIYSENK